MYYCDKTERIVYKVIPIYSNYSVYTVRHFTFSRYNACIKQFTGGKNLHSQTQLFLHKTLKNIHFLQNDDQLWNGRYILIVKLRVIKKLAK